MTKKNKKQNEIQMQRESPLDKEQLNKIMWLRRKGKANIVITIDPNSIEE